MSPNFFKSKIETQSGHTIIPVLFFNSYGISPKTLDQRPVVWVIPDMGQIKAEISLSPCLPELRFDHVGKGPLGTGAIC